MAQVRVFGLPPVHVVHMHSFSIVGHVAYGPQVIGSYDSASCYTRKLLGWSTAAGKKKGRKALRKPLQ